MKRRDPIAHDHRLGLDAEPVNPAIEGRQLPRPDKPRGEPSIPAASRQATTFGTKPA